MLDLTKTPAPQTSIPRIWCNLGYLPSIGMDKSVHQIMLEDFININDPASLVNTKPMFCKLPANKSNTVGGSRQNKTRGLLFFNGSDSVSLYAYFLKIQGRIHSVLPIFKNVVMTKAWSKYRLVLSAPGDFLAKTRVPKIDQAA